MIEWAIFKARKYTYICQLYFSSNLRVALRGADISERKHKKDKQQNGTGS